MVMTGVVMTGVVMTGVVIAAAKPIAMAKWELALAIGTASGAPVLLIVLITREDTSSIRAVVGLR